MALLVTREIRLSSSVSAASIGTDVSLAPGGHGQQRTCFSTPAPPHRGSLPCASTHLTANKVAGLCPARATPSGSSHPPYLAVHQGFLCVAFDFPASTSHRVFLGGGYAASSFGSLIQNLTLPTVFNVPKGVHSTLSPDTTLCATLQVTWRNDGIYRFPISPPHRRWLFPTS